MNHALYDFRDINRGLKRKITTARKNGNQQLVFDFSFAQNVSKALDSLVLYWKMTAPPKGVE